MNMKILILALFILLPVRLQADWAPVPPDLAGKVLLILSKRGTVEIQRDHNVMEFRVNASKQSYDITATKNGGPVVRTSYMWLPDDSGIVLSLHGPIDPAKVNDELQAHFQRFPPHSITYFRVNCEEAGKIFRIHLAAGVDFSKDLLNELKALGSSKE